MATSILSTQNAQLVFNVVLGFFSVVLGSLTLLIAWQQTVVNRRQLRLNLFEKRLEVYEAAMQFIGIVLIADTVTYEQRIDFKQKTKAARFLISKGAEEYFGHLNGRAILIGDQYKRIEMLRTAGMNQEWQEAIKKHEELREWFNEQLDQLPMRFDKCLKIEPVRSLDKAFSDRFSYKPVILP